MNRNARFCFFQISRFPLLKISSVKYFRLDVSGVTTVTVHAFVGGVLINHDRLVADELGLNVTLGTSHVGMASGQGKMGSRVVIKR